MRSSYRENNYGQFFSALVAVHKPKVIVECGVLYGYSLASIASSAMFFAERIVAYDLFEDYQYTKAHRASVEESLDNWGLLHIVELVKQDAVEAAKNHEDGSIDFLHIDIGNDAEKLGNMFDVWTRKMKVGGIVIFEGGSFERDQVEWMIKYNRPPIANFIQTLKNRGFEHMTMVPFPSVTLCRKYQ